MMDDIDPKISQERLGNANISYFRDIDSDSTTEAAGKFDQLRETKKEKTAQQQGLYSPANSP